MFNIKLLDMSNLEKFTRNGGLSNTRHGRTSNFPSISSWFDDLALGEFPSLLTSNFNTGISLPKVNIKEESEAYIVEMAVPGLKKSDFNIDIDNKTLSISAELEEDSQKEEDGYTRREFGYSSFKRTFTLPETVDDEKIEAKYNEGILFVTLPKREEAKQKPPRNIEIS